MATPTLNGYDLTRNWFDFCFENPELIKPLHTAIYCFAIEHCNRLGWKTKYGFPSQMTMDAIGVKKYQTYIKHFNELIEWGFFDLIQKSKNQYSANIISLVSAMPKNGKAVGKALDKAIIMHGAKHGVKQGKSTGQSKDSINKPVNNKPINQQTNKQVTEASTVYNQIRKIFLDEFKEFTNTAYYFEGRDGAKINSIIKKIKHAYKAKKNPAPTDTQILDGFRHILNRAMADEWIADRLTLSIIDSQFNKLKIGKNAKKENLISEVLADING